MSDFRTVCLLPVVSFPHPVSHNLASDHHRFRSSSCCGDSSKPFKLINDVITETITTDMVHAVIAI